MLGSKLKPSALYTDLGKRIAALINRDEYKLVTYPSSGDLQAEKTIIAHLISNKRAAGLILIPIDETAMRDTFDKLGVKVVTVTDSQFDANLQLTQLEGMRLQQLDVIISLPVDGEITSSKYKELSKTTKLIFISGLPQSLTSEDYSSIVSVNEHQNGRNAGKILGDYFKELEHVKIGLIKQGSPHFIARQRDFAAEQILTDSYPNIEIVAQKNFYRVDNVYAIT